MHNNCIMNKLTILAAAAILVPCLHANTTYTYTGHAFDYVGTSTYYGAPVTSISGFFTVQSALGANTTTFLTPPDFVDYSFTDGRFTSDLANYVPTNFWYSSGPGGPLFGITTDSIGNIVNWDLNVFSTGAVLTTVNNPSGSISGYHDSGIMDNTDANPSQSYDAYTNSREVGTWTVSPVPSVPDSGSTAGLLGLALTGVVALRRKFGLS